ncbi:MAG: NAD(+)/NADH kinase [Thermodesulfobacteriota bacterium]
MKIGIVGKSHSKEAVEITLELVEWIRSRDIEVFVERELGLEAGLGKSVNRGEIPELSDIILTLGGDGTFLAVARLASEYGVPILGINLGRLGFLTEINRDEIYSMMEHLLSGDYSVEERNMLIATIIRGEEIIGDFVVLNDVVINKGAVARIIDLQISINGSNITTFQADGLILSTPTGSTAYSLSAGGPIIYPTLPVTLITPICPHTLSNRPILVSSDAVVKVKLLPTDTIDIFLTLDGQGGIPLRMGDVVEVKKAARPLKFIKSPFIDYFKILKRKLGWGEGYGENSG